MIRRRDLLGGALAVAGAGLVGACTSDEGQGPGKPPQPQALNVRDMEVTRLSGQRRATTVEVGPQAVLEFDPDVSTTLTLTGNMIVQGVLRMRPSRPDVVHRLRFVDVDESAFQGDSMGPLDSDVGLWVMGQGALDLRGTPRAGWQRHGWHPSWRPEDEVVSAPQDAGDFSTYRAFGPADSVPSVVGPDGVEYRTEVLNLTRNVIIEGAPHARAHVFIQSQAAQSVRYVLLQWLGPRKPFRGQPTFHHSSRPPGKLGEFGDAEYPGGAFSTARFPRTEPVIGRYPLHFHHCEDGSRGSVVEGCVVRSSSRAFVPHSSHGITMRDCIAFDVINDAYWWDEGHPTDDLVWDHCAVFGARYDPVTAGEPAGFMLGQGQRMAIRDCVAVGVHGGGAGDAGIVWPAFANFTDDNVWEATDLVAHNNYGAGVYVWQDDDNHHVVARLVCYRNGAEGLVHGARRNTYRYEDLVLFDNRGPDLRHQALNRDDPGLDQYQSWHRLRAPYVVLDTHSQGSDRAIEFHSAAIDRLVIDEGARSEAGHYVFHTVGKPPRVTAPSQRSRVTIVAPDGSSTAVGPTGNG